MKIIKLRMTKITHKKQYQKWKQTYALVNSFQYNVKFLYHVKNLKNMWFSDIFRGFKNITFAWNGINKKSKCNENYEMKEYALHKICENMDFHWPVFSRIRTESTILFLYRRIRVNENPYCCIFYVVKCFARLLALLN